MAVGNVLQLIDRQITLAQECINVYYFEIVSDATGGTNSETLASAFISATLPDLLAIQSIECTHTEINVKNLNDPTDFHTTILTTANQGSVSGDCMPPYVAWSFQFVRGSLASRHGWKRISGVPESGNFNGVAAAAFTAPLTAVANAMAANLLEGGGSGSYVPRIARLEYTGGVLINVDTFPITGVAYRSITTQNTRKFGRGI